MMSTNPHAALLEVLKARFEKNMHRHEGVIWEKVQAKLEANEEKLFILSEMEETGGEPDVVQSEAHSDTYVFCDCSRESPKGRRSVCYDEEARAARKKHPPENSAVNLATTMGVELLTEEQYKELQKFEAFDLKSSSWVKTPKHIRELGGAVFCDRRYDTVFTYHNGAESYYAARGFRGMIRI